jgi:hypothetical protein
MVNPTHGLLPLGQLAGTNSIMPDTPDLAPTTNAPSAEATGAPDPGAAPANAADSDTDSNGAPPFDAAKKSEVGVADLVPSGSSVTSLSREELEKKVQALSDDLETANTESEYFRTQWQDLRLRDEALGADALTVDERKLEERLVESARELYQSEMRRREALLLLDRLRNTTEELLKTAPNYDPKTRADYEVAMRASRDYLAGRNGTAVRLGVSLADAEVADLNPELNAVVLSVGKAQGVKEGMLFDIYHNNAEVGRAKVVLARDLISAALVENLEPNVTLKVGDRVAVEAQ